MELITNTFVLVAPDCPVPSGTVPLPRGATPTIPLVQHALLSTRPYELTLEDLMLAVHVEREGLTKAEVKAKFEAILLKLFGKPYPCMRASPLPKKYGWGVHHDGNGKIAIYGVESKEYERYASGKVKGIDVVVAMRSRRER